MRFSVLGPLLVTDDDGAPVPVRATNLRVLLACLLLEANQPVPVARIERALWDRQPPASARASLHNHVMRLRRLLGDEQGEQLQAVPLGYLLACAEDELDLQEFEDLRRRAARAGRSGDWQTAADRSTEALALWRGEPLADVPGTLHDAEASRLVEARILTAEQLGEARLRLGEHDQLITDVQALIRDNPLREGLYSLLMRACDRAGRRAEALAAYQQARSVLCAELGVEPGAELRALQQRILRAEPTEPPAPPATPVRSPGPPAGAPAPAHLVPAQLPADATDFTGREQELDQLAGLLAEGAAAGTVVISTIAGMGGIGKSTLAVRAAHLSRPCFPDGQLFVDLRGSSAPRRPGDVLAELLRALGSDLASIPVDTDARAAMYRSTLAERRVLLLFDDARDAAQVRPLLPGTSASKVLITSRSRLAALTGAARFDLDVLSDAEARALLAAIVGADRSAAEPEAAEEVLARCGGLPLAIRIAAARLIARPHWTLATLAARLGSVHVLDELAVEDLAVRTSFQVSYQTLGDSTDPQDREAARAFALLGLWSGPDISLAAAARLLDRSASRTEDLLELLVEAQLLETARSGCYRLHDLLQVYAAELARADSTAEQRTAALARLCGWYLHTASRAMDLISPVRRRIPQLEQADAPPGCDSFADYDQALEWCEAERLNLVAVTGAAHVAGLDAVAWQLPAELLHFFHLRSHRDDWTSTHRTGLAAARRSGDRDGEALMLNGLGVAQNALGRPADALSCFHQALEISEETGDRPGQANTMNNIASSHHLQGRFQESIEWRVRSLPLRRASGNQFSIASTLNNLGMAHAALGQYHEAVGAYEEALTAAGRADSRYVQAAILDSLGDVAGKLGETDTAIDYLTRSAGIKGELSERHGLAVTLVKLAEALIAADRRPVGEGRLREALVIFEQLQDPAAEQVRTLLSARDR